MYVRSTMYCDVFNPVRTFLGLMLETIPIRFKSHLVTQTRRCTLYTEYMHSLSAKFQGVEQSVG